MTVIAFDGRTLSADKRVTFYDQSRTVTKIFRIGDLLIGCADSAAQSMEVVEWIKNGRRKEDFPNSQRNKDDWATVIVISSDGIDVYERTPYPIRIEDKIFATGAGRDYALAAMHLGKTSREAVELACIFDNGCGNGVDTLEL